MSIKRRNMPRFDKRKVADQSLPMLRRDFTKQSHCCLCKDSGHQLPTGKGIILLHPTEGEIAAGPTCAQKYGIKPQFSLPDLTRAILEDPQQSSGTITKSTAQPAEADVRHRAIEYLLLRQNRLPEYGFPGTKWKNFDAVFESYQSGQLTDEGLTFVQKIMAGHDANQSNLSYDNLQTLYAAAYWIARCKELKPRNGFLKKIDVILQTDRRLSDARIETLNEIIHECLDESAPQVKAFKSSTPANRPGFRPAGPNGRRPLPT